MLDPAQPSRDRLIAAAFLTCVWASLRFSDSQHVLWSSLLLDFSSLRGVSHRTKTTRRGVPFICVGSGLLGQHDSRDTWWTAAFLNLLEERRQALCAHLQHDAFAPDALFFWDALQTGDGDVDACFAPLQYGVALNWLRRFFVSVGFGSDVASVYTLRSAKATVLSWMNQLLCSLLCGTRRCMAALERSEGSQACFASRMASNHPSAQGWAAATAGTTGASSFLGGFGRFSHLRVWRCLCFPRK